MPKKDTRSLRNHHIAFAIGSFFLLVTTFWTFVQDSVTDRSYPDFQKDYLQLEAQRVSKKKEEIGRELESMAAQRQEIERRIAQAQEFMDSKQAEMEAAEAAIAELQAPLQKTTRNLNFTAAEVGVVNYEWTVDRATLDDTTLTKEEKRAFFNEKNEIEAKIAGHKKIIDDIKGPYDRAVKELAAHDAKWDELQNALQAIEGNPVLNLIKDFPGIDFVDPRWNLNDQKVLPNLPQDMKFAFTQRVDRCIVCHKGITNPDPMYAPSKGSDETNKDGVPLVFQSHPRLDLYLSANSPHPVAKFGCTICHQGRPMSVSFLRAAHTPKDEHQAQQWREKYNWDTLDKHKPGQPLWDNPMLPTRYIESSCVKCHRSVDRVPEAPKLNHGLDLFREKGCVNCHIGNTNPDFAWMGRVGPDLRRIGEKTSKQWLQQWITNPWHFRPSTKMPRLFGLENRKNDKLAGPSGTHPRDPVEIEAITTYLVAASKLRERKVPEAPKGDPANGKKHFAVLGCLGCHSTKEVADKFEFNEHGPDLSRIGSKVHAGWLYQWLKNPKNYWAETRMPSLRLTDQESADITAYLMSTMTAKQGPDIKSAPAWTYDVMIGNLLKNTTPDFKIQAILKDSTALIQNTLRMKVRSTSKRDKKTGKIIRTDSGKGEWTESQIKAVLAELDKMGKTPADRDRVKKAFFVGQAMIQNYGCFACHNIQGWTYAPLNCVNLVGNADKGIDKFDFGFNSPIGRNKWEWFYAKLTRPRGFDRGREEITRSLDRLKMPWFGYRPETAPQNRGSHEGGEHAKIEPSETIRGASGGHGPGDESLRPENNPDLDPKRPHGLTHDEVEALVTVLLSLSNEPIPVAMRKLPNADDLAVDRGERVIKALNCIGCHPVGLKRPRLQFDEGKRGKVPLEALLPMLVPQVRALKAKLKVKDLGPTALGLFSDRPEVWLKDENSGADGYLNFGRGTYLTSKTLKILVNEKLVRKTGEDTWERLGFAFETKRKNNSWVRYGSVVTKARFTELTWRLYCKNPDAPTPAMEKQAKDLVGKIYMEMTAGRKPLYVHLAAYERLAGTAALLRESGPEAKHPPFKLTSINLDRRKKLGDFYPPVEIQVRTTHHEGNVGAYLTKLFESQQMAPPSLAFEGGKVQPDWLYNFLKNVHSLRPGIQTRMPSFWVQGSMAKAKTVYPSGRLSALDNERRDRSISGEPFSPPGAPEEVPDDATQIIQFFNHIGGARPFGFQDVPERNETTLKVYEQGKKLLLQPDQGGLGCVLCHKVGTSVPAGEDKKTWGPNLIEVKRRFKDRWLQRFLTFPAAHYPWTAMPANFYDWGAYKSDPNDPTRKLRSSPEDFKKFSEHLKAVKFYLRNSGEFEIGDSKE